MKSFLKFILLGFLPIVIITFIVVFRGTLSDLSNMRINYFVTSFFLNISFCTIYVFEKLNFKFFKRIIISIFILIVLTTISILYFQYFYFKKGIVEFKYQVFLMQIGINVCILFFYIFILDVSKKVGKRKDLVFNENPVFYFKLVLTLTLFISAFLLFFFISDYVNIYGFRKALLILTLKMGSFTLSVNILSFISVYFLTKIKILKNNFLLIIFFTSILTVPSFIFLGYPKSLNFFMGYIGSFYVIQLFSPAVIISILFYKLDKRINNLKISKLEILNYKLDAEYLQLKNQVNPHFLFNNLNILISFIEINPVKAIEFGHHLSNTYRHYLKNQNEDFVLLSDEISFINEYFQIYKAKFENDFSYKIDIENNENYYIISFALQEIIDNIFKHNILDDENVLQISILIDQEYLKITNSKNLKLNTNSNKLGLQNIIKRYEFFSNKEVEISNDETIFFIKIPILRLEK